MLIDITLNNANDEEIALTCETSTIISNANEVLLPVDEVSEDGLAHFINEITFEGTVVNALAVVTTGAEPSVSVQFFGETHALPYGWEQICIALVELLGQL